MRLWLAVVMAVVVGCGSSGKTSDVSDAASVADVGYHDAAPAPAVDAGLDEKGAEMEAGVDAPPEATIEAGGLLCCSTGGGQNLLTCDPSAPWPCLASLTHGSPCTDPACVVGDSCQGFNGMGTVVVCGM